MNNDFYSFMRESRFGKFLVVLILLLAAYVAMLILAEAKAFHYIGGGVAATNVITVNGSGDVFAVPDIATFTVTVMEEKADVADAQKAAAEKINAIIAYLKSSGVEDKDIKTVAYNVAPRYEYTAAADTVCARGYCPPGNQVLKGFDASQTLAIKVRDTKKAGELLSGVGTKGAQQVSGLDFTIDDEDKLKSEAREKAINDARAKAAELTKQLGVHIVRVVNFSESGNGPMPYYAYGAGKAMDAVTAQSAPPETPMGQNQITSNVAITYEIR
jgi:uncharacterized protein YggE